MTHTIEPAERSEAAGARYRADWPPEAVRATQGHVVEFAGTAADVWVHGGPRRVGAPDWDAAVAAALAELDRCGGTDDEHVRVRVLTVVTVREAAGPIRTVRPAVTAWRDRATHRDATRSALSGADSE